MNLSNELITQFVKATKDTSKTSSGETVNGTTVEYNGKMYVKLDGSDLLTPVTTTADVVDNERVTVLIKDHSATITGNTSSPAARTDDVKDVKTQITEFEILIGGKVSAEELEAQKGRIDELVSDNIVIREKLTATEAEIDSLVAEDVAINGKLTAQDAEITRLDVEKLTANAADIKFATIENLEVLYGEFHSLEATYGEFQKLATDKFEAVDANIKNLDAEKLDVEAAEITYANIDFANITEAAVEKIFADSGIIEDLIVSEGKITGELVGVTIKGDLIEAGTLKADKLVVLGSDGIYYKLNIESGATVSEEVTEEELQNGLHGTAIIAKTITAEKIAVDDLVAFDATIGGFKITNSSLYSGVKESASNTTRGVYLDKEGQLVVGDSNNFLKYYKNNEGNYVLEISAASMSFSTNGSSVATQQDIDDSVSAITESVSALNVRADGVEAVVSELKTTTDASLESVNENIESLSKEVSTKMSSDAVDIKIQTALDDGVSKVTTSTGFTFNDEGLSVRKSGSEMMTQITEDGMTVYQNDESVLVANNQGVDAKNLHATTYLIVGGRSRFENYGENRTGCFWIGG